MENMHKKVMVILFLLTIGLIPLLSLIAMPRERFAFSVNENRYLAAFPRFSLDRVLDTEYMRGFEDWANDRIIGRESWLRLRNRAEISLGKIEIGGAFITPERMLQVWQEYDEDLIDRSLAAMDAFAARHSETPVFFMLAPTAQEIYRSSLPEYVPLPSQYDFIRYCYDGLENVTPVDVLTPLEDNSEWYLYYRTDHHWTSLGAFIAYSAAAPVLGFTPLGLGSFTAENFGGFLGTLYSMTLINTVTPDVISIYKPTGSAPAITLTVGGNEFGSLYFREYLDTKDKYSVFLGANAPVIEIKSEPANTDKRLLIFKDSYAHSLIPFLVNNYSEITVADLRLINTVYSELFNVEDYDAVLFVYNVISFSEDTNLIKLNTG
jgi:hypothetical protein